MISIISLETLDADQFNIKWTSGPENEFIMKAYEIEIRNYMQNEIKRSLVVGGFNYIVEGMKCTSNSTTYQMSVRPINVIRENQIQGCVVTYKTVLAIENWDNYTNGRNYQNALHLKEEISSFSKDNHTFIRLIYGPWSVPLLYECNKTAATSVTHAIVIPAVLLLIIITAALLYYIRRRYKTAKSIGIVLPPGLSDDESKTSQGGKYDETDYSTDEAEEANFIEARSLIDENMDEGYCTSQRDSLSSSTDEVTLIFFLSISSNLISSSFTSPVAFLRFLLFSFGTSYFSQCNFHNFGQWQNSSRSRLNFLLQHPNL